jgi:hypothetical protein
MTDFENNENRINKVNQTISSVNEIFSYSRNNVNTLMSIISLIKNHSLQQNSIKFAKDAINIIVTAGTSNAIQILFKNYITESAGVIDKIKELLSQHSQADMISSPGYTNHLTKIQTEVKHHYERVNTTYSNIKNISKATYAADRISTTHTGSTAKVFSKCPLQIHAELNILFHDSIKNIPMTCIVVHRYRVEVEIKLRVVFVVLNNYFI